MKKKQPLKYYKQAFMQFSGATPRSVRYKKLEWSLLVKWKGDTYLVTHIDDFKRIYHAYFSEESYSEIYTEIPFLLWEILLSEKISIDTPELLIAIYTQWKLYWEDKQREIKGGVARYERFRRKSWEDLQVLFTSLTLNDENPIEYAGEINEAELIPIIAMVIKDRYEDLEAFVDECVEVLVSRCKQFITYGPTFEEVTFIAGVEGFETYFIYNPSYRYEDMVKQLTVDLKGV